jgi:TorA maturation chaperone TorD
MIATRQDDRELWMVRQGVYRFLWLALRHPDAEQHAWMRSGEFARTLGRLLEEFGLSCPDGELVPEDPADHEARYIACFEVGLPAPPVALLASNYNHREPVPRTIHEHVLFCKQFGLPIPLPQEPADHLLNELPFLIHLDKLLLAGRGPAESIVLARRDFLARHAARWPAAALHAALEAHLPPLYLALLALLDAAVRQDLELTEETLAREKEVVVS